MGLRIAVDIGGTFTDFCILDERTGVMRVAKTASTRDPIGGLFAGLEQEHVDLTDVTLFSHGTTVATNALITRRLPAGRDGRHRGFPRRDRDPPRQQGRSRGTPTRTWPAPTSPAATG